jgi:hypothetical protein
MYIHAQMVEDEYEVWLCDRWDPCLSYISSGGDMMCYTFNEQTETFHPLGLNSQLQFVFNATQNSTYGNSSYHGESWADFNQNNGVSASAAATMSAATRNHVYLQKSFFSKGAGLDDLF